MILVMLIIAECHLLRSRLALGLRASNLGMKFYRPDVTSLRACRQTRLLGWAWRPPHSGGLLAHAVVDGLGPVHERDLLTLAGLRTAVAVEDQPQRHRI